MTISQEILHAGRAVSDAADDALPDVVNAFIGRFIGKPFRAVSGILKDAAGNRTERLNVICTRPQDEDLNDGTLDADGAAAVIDTCPLLTIEALRAAYRRVSQAKALKKAPIDHKRGTPRTSVTLGLILALRSNAPMETLADELDKLNRETPASYRPDMVCIASTGTLSYAIQFPGEGVSGDFLPPGDGAIEAYIPPMYIVMMMRPTGPYTLNRMTALLIAHLAIFSPGAELPRWNEVLDGTPKQGVTLSGYQYNQTGELLPVPPQFYSDRYIAPLPLVLEDASGKELATLQFVPWQDGGVIILRGKLPLEGLMVFLGPDALKRGGIVSRPPAQISYALPITQADFRLFIKRIQSQSNMTVRKPGVSWTVKKAYDEGSSSPVMARIFIGLLRLRDQIYTPESRDAFDAPFDTVLTPLLSARKAMQDFKTAWDAHAAKIESGVAARVERGNIHVDESVDSVLRQHADTFLNASTRALKNGMQSLTTELGVNIGFLFQKQAAFEAGVAALDAADPALAEYLRHTRLWSQRLVDELRNAIEHKNWKLPDVTYARDGNDVKATEPLIDGEPASAFVTSIFDRLACFVEEVTTHCLQKKLPDDIRVSEIPFAERRAEMPERFRPTLMRGGAPRWTITAHKRPFDQT
jgi:hypothetical protein